uniref:Cytochrome b561 domain-containing protein n=1 Tax=Pectinophora gossypiella TaxID=13191 RepID=A0A1E1W530_PECGO
MVIPPPPRMPENGNYAPGPAIVNEPPSSFLIVMNITNIITQLLLGAVTCCAIITANFYLPFNGTAFSTHIYLCVIGYVVLMTQAILSLSPFTGWSNTFKHQDKKTIHLVMQIIGSILAITGSMIRIFNVAAHFQSAHGSLGKTNLDADNLRMLL